MENPLSQPAVHTENMCFALVVVVLFTVMLYGTRDIHHAKKAYQPKCF